jgi:hypothetical protein
MRRAGGAPPGPQGPSRQTVVIRRRFAEWVNSTCVTARQSGHSRGYCRKIFSNVDPNVEGGENVSFSLKPQLPV